MTPQTQTHDIWDARDAESRPWEAVLQEHWEEQERDAMFAAETDAPSLMERVTGPLLFLLALGFGFCLGNCIGQAVGEAIKWHH